MYPTLKKFSYIFVFRKSYFNRSAGSINYTSFISIGDPCQFFTGKEYHLLLKVVLIFEVCSGKWDQTKIDQDIRNLNTGESNLMTFLSSCMSSDNTILKLHYPVPNDPTIGKFYLDD